MRLCIRLLPCPVAESKIAVLIETDDVMNFEVQKVFCPYLLPDSGYCNNRQSSVKCHFDNYKSP